MGILDRWEQVKKDKTRVASIDRRRKKIKAEDKELRDEKKALIEKWEKVEDPAIDEPATTSAEPEAAK